MITCVPHHYTGQVKLKLGSRISELIHQTDGFPRSLCVRCLLEPHADNTALPLVVWPILGVQLANAIQYKPSSAKDRTRECA